MTTLKAKLHKAIARDYETCCKDADRLLVTQYDTAKKRVSAEGQAWASGYRSGAFEENQRVLKILEQFLR